MMNLNFSKTTGLARLLGALITATVVLSAPAVAHAEGEPQAAAATATVTASTTATASAPATRKARPAVRKAKAALDHSGRQNVGIASFYANHFAGRKMANGKPMRPESDNAASKTLPLGTRAQVTNLSNGRVAIVTITDRGPYVRGRIIDVSPSTARKLGISGLARVQVTPLTVPQPDGTVRTHLALADTASNGAHAASQAL
jgi:rare lipoprotein A